jgi:hypothetical protein
MPPLAFMPLHIERLLCSGQICWVYVSSGSATDLRELDLDAVDLPAEQACHTVDDWVRHVRPSAGGGHRQVPGISSCRCRGANTRRWPHGGRHAQVGGS